MVERRLSTEWIHVHCGVVKLTSNKYQGPSGPDIAQRIALQGSRSHSRYPELLDKLRVHMRKTIYIWLEAYETRRLPAGEEVHGGPAYSPEIGFHVLMGFAVCYTRSRSSNLFQELQRQPAPRSPAAIRWMKTNETPIS